MDLHVCERRGSAGGSPPPVGMCVGFLPRARGTTSTGHRQISRVNRGQPRVLSGGPGGGARAGQRGAHRAPRQGVADSASARTPGPA
eukprot:scaffold1291_cov412-Prasinococcus_capsulatus_cf.AAC.5